MQVLGTKGCSAVQQHTFSVAIIQQTIGLAPAPLGLSASLLSTAAGQN